MRAGVIFSDEHYKLFSSGFDFESNNNRKVFDSKGDTYVLQAFIEWKYRLSERLTLNTGLHYLRFFLNNENSIEPRAGLIWRINKKHALSMGVGLHSRIEPISVYLTNISLNNTTFIQANKNIGLSKSFHAVLGYDLSFNDNLHLKVEAYYQYLFNIPVGTGIDNEQFSVLNIRYGFVTCLLANSGKGRNLGIDLTFERYFTKSYYFMVTGSLYDSRYTPSDGKEYNTTFNGHYIFNALVGKEWTLGRKQNKTLGINSRFLYRGGMRYQGIDLAASNLTGQPIYNKNENYTLITPDVYNIDVGINFKVNRKKVSWLVSLDVNNLTNKKSIIGMKYNIYSGSIKYNYDLQLLPVLSLKVNV